MHPEGKVVMLPSGYPDWTQSRCVLCGGGWPCRTEQGCLTCEPINGWLTPVYNSCKGRYRDRVVYHMACVEVVLARRFLENILGKALPSYFDHIALFYEKATEDERARFAALRAATQAGAAAL